MLGGTYEEELGKGQGLNLVKISGNKQRGWAKLSWYACAQSLTCAYTHGWAPVLIKGFGGILSAASSSHRRQPAGLCSPVACGSGRTSSHRARRLCNGNNPTLPTNWGSRVLEKAGRA